MEDFLQREYFDNTVRDYLMALGVILVSIVAVRILRTIVLGQLKKWATRTETTVDDFLIKGLEKFGLPLLNVVAIYFGLHLLSFPVKAANIIDVAFKIILTYYFIRIITSTINLSLTAYFQKQERGEEKVKGLKGIMVIVTILIWLVGIIFLFDNLGYDVTTIIAGLGVGGIAIALAAQTILGDLFNYFVIFFDRPFEIGDFIIVDTKMGVIEKIGIKTTRVISLSGEQIIFSNSDLTSSRIHNYKRMQRRRVLFKISVVYQTPAEKLKLIPEIIKSIIENTEKTQFDRAHFAAYGDFSLNFEVVYYVLSSDYNVYMDIQQQINLQIYSAFEREGIAFAIPAQRVFLDKKGIQNSEFKIQD